MEHAQRELNHLFTFKFIKIMATERNYNGVTIEKTWSFTAFAKQFGKPKLAPCVNHDTGECLNPYFNGTCSKRDKIIFFFIPEAKS